MSIGEVNFSYDRTDMRFHVGLKEKLKAELFYTVFDKLFDIVHADTQELKNEAHRVRYQVFCVENQGFEDPAAHPDGLERDEFDDNADHVLLFYKPLGRAIGTVRVIKPREDNWKNSFPLQDLSDSPFLHTKEMVMQSCEFSRFCISRELRQDAKNHMRRLSNIFEFNADEPFSFYEKPLVKTVLSAAPLGLVRGGFELTMKNKALNVFGCMENRHITGLRNAGMIMNPIDNEIDFHGKRIPFHGNILEIYDHTIVQQHALWKMLSKKGKNHCRALEIYKESHEE
jgi:N-acyl amino acid synthase of PEP-CTERM/exosortase system